MPKHRDKPQTIRKRVLEFLNERRKALAGPLAGLLVGAAAKIGLDLDPAAVLSIATAISVYVTAKIRNVVRGAKVDVLDAKV